MKAAPEKEAIRLARFLGDQKAGVRAAAKARFMLVESGERGTLAVPAATIAAMAAAGLLLRDGKSVRLSPAGLALGGRRSETGVLPEGRGELDLARAPDGSDAEVLIDLDESPLAQLARRRQPDGRPYLEAEEIRAGERLRSDYTRGRIMPRLGANWIASVASGRRGGAGGAAELTDAALAARRRVEKAIAAVGPELSGVLLDVCCYLKGLERVEAERRWPPRSAKILLKSALGVLSRHYEPARARRGSLLHWGSDDFRPSIDG